MDIDDAIRILDPETTAEALAEIEYYNGFSGHFAKVEACDEACEVAVAVMRAQQAAEKNDPLTLDELRQMGGQPVWIDDWIEPYNGWELSEDASDYFEGRDVKKYGSAWVAYRRPPKEDAK